MNNHKFCLLCKSEQLYDLPLYEKAFLTKCKKCNFTFSKKSPTENELLNHYNNYGRSDYLSPITIKRYNELLDNFEMYKKTNKILDVGCGIGYFLFEAKKRGWRVYGTEYTDSAVRICKEKGILINKGKLDINNYQLESFDIITSFEVIEHINNPLEEISNFKNLLRLGGLAYVTTPNFNSLSRHILKSKYNVITYPEHLSYYSPRTLKKLFKKTGFKNKKIKTTGISLTRYKTSSGKSNQKFISDVSDDEKIRTKIESNSYLKKVIIFLNFILSVFGIGDNLKGWFIKD